LFYTRGHLTSEVVKAIENRAQHRVTQGPNAKWQFFGLPQGQMVVSYLVGVPEPDDFGRKGRYLAHSLIIEPTNWSSLRTAPFSLMQPRYFSQTIDHALSLGNLKTGEVGPATIDVSSVPPDHAVAAARQWPTGELRKLCRLGFHSLGILQRGHFVAFVGTEQQIYDALNVAFYVAPPARLQCSFDTSATGCSWPREINFWGQGFAEEREARTPFVVLTTEKKVRLPNDWSPPETPDEQWAKNKLGPEELATIHLHQQSVSAMSSILTGEVKKSEQLAPVSEVVEREFANDNSAAVKARIDELLPRHLPPYLADKVMSKIGRSPVERLRWLQRNQNGEAIGDILFEVFADWEESLSDQTRRSMNDLISRHAGLRLLCALWVRDEKGIHDSLSVMSADEYRQYVDKLRLRKYAMVHDFFCAKHLNLWFEILGIQITIMQIGAAIVITSKYGTQRDCDELAVLAEKISSRREREALLDWLKEQGLKKRMKALVAALKESLRTGSGSSSEGSSSRFSWLKR
jgi:hypothetical protein